MERPRALMAGKTAFPGASWLLLAYAWLLMASAWLLMASAWLLRMAPQPGSSAWLPRLAPQHGSLRMAHLHGQSPKFAVDQLLGAPGP